MSFNRRCDSIFPGMGVSVRNDTAYLNAGISLSGTAQQSNSIPSSGSLSTTFSAGRLRIKIYNGGGTSPTLVDLIATCTDGTNTIVLANSALHPNAAIALLSTQWLEFEFEFVLDVASSGTGSGALGQLSSGGANALTIKTTLGGTSPTATMDAELVPLI